jgi:hypothetical protein
LRHFGIKELAVQIPFHLIDVFADQPLTGNPLAVVPQADGLDHCAILILERRDSNAGIFNLV